MQIKFLIGFCKTKVGPENMGSIKKALCLVVGKVLQLMPSYIQKCCQLCLFIIFSSGS